MGKLREKILLFFGSKSRTFRRTYMYIMGRPKWSLQAYATFADEAYKKNPYVYAAISTKASAVATPPPVLYEIKGKRIEDAAEQASRYKGYYSSSPTLQKAAQSIIRREAGNITRQTGMAPVMARRLAVKRLESAGQLRQIDAHPLLDLLARPNPYYQTSYNAFVTAWVSYLEITGKTFIEPVGPRSDRSYNQGVPKELYVLDADKIQPKHTASGDGKTLPNPLPGFTYEGGDKIVWTYDPDPLKTDIFYSKYFNPTNPLDGMSPLMAAMYSIDVNNEARSWALSTLLHGGSHSGIMTTDSTLSEEQVNAIRQQYQEQSAGAKNAGKPMVFDGGLSWTNMSMTARDLEWNNGLILTAREIAVVTNVPSEILGDSANKTYSNVKEARKALFSECALPLADFMFGEWNSTFVRRFGDNLMLDYDIDQVAALQEDMSELYSVLSSVPFLTYDEKRSICGWEETPGGKVLLVPVNLVPIDMVSTAGIGDDDITKAILEYGGHKMITNGATNEKGNIISIE